MYLKATQLKGNSRSGLSPIASKRDSSSLGLFENSAKVKRLRRSTNNLIVGTRIAGGSSTEPSIQSNSPSIVIGGVDLFGNNIGAAFNLGNMGGTTYNYGDFVGGSDTTDFFRFTLSGSTTFNLSLSGLSADADIRLYNGSGSEIARSALSGTANEAISRSLTSGTYYAEVYAFGAANTNYSLRLQGVSGTVDPGTSISTARDQGNITRGNRSINDFVGSTDTNDYIQFQLSEYSEFNLSLGNLASDADVQLLSSSGTVIASSTRAGTAAEAIATRLNVGTYYVRVYPFSGSSNYQLNFNASSISDLAGNTTSTARSITVDSTVRNYDDWVGTVDTNDYYRFTLGSAGTLNLSISQLTADADVALLGATGNIITSSIGFGTSNETISRSLAAGTYFIRVYPFSGANTPYRLAVSAIGGTPPPPGVDPGNTLGTAEVKTSPIFSRIQQVSSTDNNDFYRFSVGQSGVFTANLTGLSGDADMRLIKDANNNGAIDRGEVEAWQWERSTSSESIRKFLTTGTYFLQVNNYNNQTANYSVSTGFSAAASDNRRFSISVNFLSTASALTAAMRNAVIDAAKIWERVIGFSSFSGNHNLTINVGGSNQAWGPNGRVLASAGPTALTTDANGRSMPTSGISNINTNPGAISFLTSGIDFFRGVMAHEFGHVLGIGTLWEGNGRAFVNRTTGTYNANTYAGWAYGELRNTFTQTAVPVTTGVGGGSDYSHWREQVFGNELMTHSANSGGMPLSQLTIATMRDIGWNVNYGAAEPYTLASGQRTSSQGLNGGFQLDSGSLPLQMSCGCSAHLMASGFHTTGTSRFSDLIAA